MKKRLIWDSPTRIFHWSLVILVSISFTTGLIGGFDIMDYHQLSGYGILTLVIFRIIWGVIGNDHARFTQFIKGPAATFTYLRRILHREPTEMDGHNPLGALSVISLLAALLIQATTGLFANDDILLEGPLVHLVSNSTSQTLTAIHETMAWILAGLVTLHLIAIAYHSLIRREDLLLPMLRGWRESNTLEGNAKNPRLRGLVVFSLVAAGVYGLITYL